MILVCGIHGVGKTAYCKKIAGKNGFQIYSASNLICKNRHQPYMSKKVEDIDLNQRILIEEVNRLNEKKENFILDGHLCLINIKGKVEKIPLVVFRLLKIDCLIVLIDSPQKIKERMENRDHIKWEIDFIKKFQEQEIKYAVVISKELNIDLKIITISKMNHGISSCFSKNIILPIKPLYAERILYNKKKFEYRKTICLECIDKIYLYAMTPIKKIVGEAEVIAKLKMHKENLWDLSKEMSGINKSYYDEYFENAEFACAYQLGKVKWFNKKITLQEINIPYNLQSYMYIKELDFD